MNQCCICLEQTSDEKDTAITVCGHNYHTSCLLKWISNSKNFCPLCRLKLVDQEILPEAPEPEPSLDIYRGIIELTTNNKFSWNYTYNSSVSSNDFKFNHTADSIKWINILMNETKNYRLEIEYKISGNNNKTDSICPQSYLGSMLV